MDLTNKLRFGRNDFSPTIKKLLKNIGDERIHKIVVVRHPLPSILKISAYLLTRVLFDSLFHLYLTIYMDSHVIIVEKNQNVHITTTLRTDKNDESITIRNVPSITLNQFLKIGIDRMGSSFWNYQAGQNNCQVFCLNLLEASGINEGRHFILQDTKSIFENRPI
jgi:hypothetical protein